MIDPDMRYAHDMHTVKAFPLPHSFTFPLRNFFTYSLTCILKEGLSDRAWKRNLSSREGCPPQKDVEQMKKDQLSNRREGRVIFDQK